MRVLKCHVISPPLPYQVMADVGPLEATAGGGWPDFRAGGSSMKPHILKFTHHVLVVYWYTKGQFKPKKYEACGVVRTGNPYHAVHLCSHGLDTR